MKKSKISGCCSCTTMSTFKCSQNSPDCSFSKFKMASNQSSGVITDPRFVSLHTDPRFAKNSRKSGKMDVDGRFAAVFNDPRFQVTGAGKKSKRPRSKDEDDDNTEFEVKVKELSASGSTKEKNKIDGYGKNKNNTSSKNKTTKTATTTTFTSTSTTTEKASKTSKSKAAVDPRFVAAAAWGKTEDEDEDDEDDEDGEEVDDAEALEEYARMLKEQDGDDDGDDNNNYEDSSDSGAAPKQGDRFKNETVEDRLARLTKMSRGEWEYSGSEEDSSSDDEFPEGGDEAKEDAYAQQIVDELAGPDVIQDPDAPDLNQIEYMDDEDEDEGEGEGEGEGQTQQKKAQRNSNPDGGATKRLALVNCDWEQLRAVDILAALQSFAPRPSAVISVHIYASDYGIKKIQDEAKLGPQNIFLPVQSEPLGNEKGGKQKGKVEKKDKPKASAASSSNTSTTATTSTTITTVTTTATAATAVAPKLSYEEMRRVEMRKRHVRATGDEGDAFDPVRLRQYELNKMKYYFAIVQFDTPASANIVYQACDGVEVEATSNVMDLRFVPDDTSFEGRPVRDTCTFVPDSYEPPVFSTRALQSSRVELTWDGDDPQRTRALAWDKLANKKKKNDGKRQKGKKGKGNNNNDDDDDDNALADLKNYLAPASDESDDDEEELEEKAATSASKSKKKSKLSKTKEREAQRAKYKALLAAGNDEDDDDDEGDGDAMIDDDSDDELKGGAITFVPGANSGASSAKDILKNRAERKAKENESEFEAFQRKRKEKKKAKKEARKAARLAGRNPNTKVDTLGATNDDDDDDDDDDERIASVVLSKTKGNQTNKTKNHAGTDSLDENDDFFASTAADSKKKKASHTKNTKAASLAEVGFGRGAEYDQDESDDDNGGSGPRGNRFEDKNTIARRERAQLSLLLNDDEENGGAGRSDDDGATEVGGNFSVKALVKAQKQADKAAKKEAKKEKHMKTHSKSATASAGASSSSLAAGVDVTDSRFAAAFSAPDFAIDPTAPQFKDTAGMRTILSARTEGKLKQQQSAAATGTATTATSRPMIAVRADGVRSSTSVVGAIDTSGGSNSNSNNNDGSDINVLRLANAVKAKFQGGLPPTAQFASEASNSSSTSKSHHHKKQKK